MALTNAERQKRHRERVQSRLKAMAPSPPASTLPPDEADEGSPNFLDLIHAHYLAGARGIAEKINSDWSAPCLDEVAAGRMPTWADTLDWAERAGQMAWSAAFNRRDMERIRARTADPAPAPQPAAKPRPRRAVTGTK